MSEHDTSEQAGGEAAGLEHDASPGGGPVNAPGDEPDAESQTEREQGDAGRNDVVKDQPAAPHPPG